LFLCAPLLVCRHIASAAFQPFLPLEVSSLYYDLFQQSIRQYMSGPESARPGYLSRVPLALPLVQPRVEAIDAALLFVDMSGAH
jgi:hypothetical protein